ncbi:hypothetical protein MYCTH_2123876 [Thermothelomyces thermophilus ATCC 42464]|uniref:ML-like domain-containing protein n=1 Tax=Thermothelomyces thermophilus (strain ATCC 42464 / BCRC 31852 / DSM 1799) TaxID=573729 RepID=G2Q149_THET4|nr:uncharacterized protein MYCTH_2123876 [Thermothelomyces thermophilus ATCC 42464]AEO54948.1 hypothetical protein MYCTH_2123876 [Thermothelomyces thermophilus ATCC 42464]
MAPWNRIRLPIWIILFSLFSITSQAREAKAAVPGLYTGNFGNCLAGESVLEVTRFDVAYDAGNRTLVLRLDGTSSVKEESVMLHLSIDGYGANRFVMAVDPCSFNISSLCTLSAKKTFSARTVLPAGAQRVGELSDFPFNLPDYEGSAKLQMVAKSNQEVIGCVQASMTNGRTLSQPEIVAPVLGVFTLVAIVASFMTAAYGVSVPHMRMHHAHSLSVLVTFETLQTVFFTGALSVHWPPILMAWWSNFAWSAGLIYIRGMVRSINKFAGVDDSATRFLGSGESPPWLLARSSAVDGASGSTGKGRPAYNSSFLHDYTWSGSLAAPGLPLPGGTWSGFPATLSVLGIPVADAFMIGLIWLLIAIGLVALATGGFKTMLEGLAATGRIKKDRLHFFRSHWTGYLGHAMLRTLVVAFFMLMTLAMMQLTIRMTVGPVAVATVVFIFALIGLIGLIASSCKARTRDGRFQVTSDPVICFRKKTSGKIPGLRFGYGLGRESTIKTHALDVQPVFRIPLFKIRHSNNDPDRPSVHLDERFVKRFGWLTARYRRSRWWFLAYHVGYLFCRAAFLGGGWKTPRVQVCGVLAVDVVNFVVAAILSPFEGARNTVMGVWILGICKIVTGGVAAAMLSNPEIKRSKAAELGIVIIAVQALAVAALLVLIVLSAASSFLSLMRNREEMDPDWLEPVRVAYFTKMERKARDARFVNETEPPPPTPRFSVLSIRRRPKIEDEDEDMNPAPYGPEQQHHHHHQQQQEQEQEQEQEQATPDDSSADDSRSRARRSHGSYSRAGSVSPRLSTGSLPPAARPYRLSWSSRELGELAAAGAGPSSRPDSVLTKRLSGVTCVVVTDCDAAPSNASWVEPESARPRDSTCSLGTRTPSASRSSSPAIGRSPSPGFGRSSREFVVGGSSAHVDGRRPPTALPEAPEPQE